MERMERSMSAKARMGQSNPESGRQRNRSSGEEDKKTAKKSRQLIGAIVEERFKQKWPGGIVTGVDACMQTALPIWRVKYDDGDEEDLYENELNNIARD